MLNTTDTLWALLEYFGDRREVVDGLSLLGTLGIGYVFLILIWG